MPSYRDFLLFASYFAGIQGFYLPPGRLAVGPSRNFSSARFMVMRKAPPPDFTVIEDEENGDSTEKKSPFASSSFDARKERVSFPKPAKFPESAQKGRKRISSTRMDGTSWLEKNAAFYDEELDDGAFSNKPPQRRSNRTFRQVFQGTRVFVQGIPPGASWQDLKDHFKVAGSVVFASISMDPVGNSKGQGIVQFETSEMAQNAIRIMRNHPLNGKVLYVREDVQEQRKDSPGKLRNQVVAGRRNTPPSQWECADDENSSILSAEEREDVISLIVARDAARRKRNYDESDRMRRELKVQFGVHLDDRLKQWWVSFDGSYVPLKVKAIKGDGRWGEKKAWRQIPTTPDNDACVNADLVNGLLMQRDISRREKDFSTADALLEEARNSPDGDLTLRIHDESRTWRIWTDEPPPRPVDHSNVRKSAAEQCIDLVREKAPHKEEEIEILLSKFPGREYGILKKLKKSLANRE